MANLIRIEVGGKIPADITGSASVCMARLMRGKSICSSVVTKPTVEEGRCEGTDVEVETRPSPMLLSDDVLDG